MEWLDIAGIVFACVTANHLGLIGAFERVMGKSIPVINCPKCASFWCTLAYLVGKMGFLEIPRIPTVLALSFLASYAAIWLELFEGFIDTIYMKLYGTIYTTSTDAVASDADGGDSDGSVSDVRQGGQDGN